MEKETLVRDLNVGDKIKLFNGAECIFEVIEKDPRQYVDSVRVKGNSITFPLHKSRFVNKISE